MHRRRGAALVLWGVAAAAILAMVLIVVIKKDSGADPPAAKQCKDEGPHSFAADPGKTNPDNLGPPVQDPTNLDNVHFQFNVRHCLDPMLIATSEWYLNMPDSPRDADGINLLAGMLSGNNQARAASGDAVIASVWNDQAKPHIGYWSGTYWTMAARDIGDGHWAVYQTQVSMQLEPVLEITFPDGTTGQWKLSCGFQPISKVGMFQGIPTAPNTFFVPIVPAPPQVTQAPPPGPGPAPTSPTPTGGPTTTPKVTVTTQPGGKQALQHPISNVHVPAIVKGCGPSGCGGVTAKPANPGIQNPNPVTGCNPTCPGNTPPTVRPGPPPSSVPVPATTAPPGPSPKPGP